MSVKQELAVHLSSPLSRVFSDGGPCPCRAGGGLWEGVTGPHLGAADLWRLLDGKNSGGIFILTHLIVVVI